MLEELKKEAKELGVKSAHLYKNEEKLKNAIKKAKTAQSIENIVKTDTKPKKNDINHKARDVKYIVCSGKIFVNSKMYKKGDIFTAKTGLDKIFTVKMI